MKNISEIDKCYGCMACTDRCPVSCISPIETKLGHIIPHVDENRCINCGACLKVCPSIMTNSSQYPQQAIAAWDKNESDRIKSSSGALATILAEEVIKNGGIVYGCAFVAPFMFKHVRCENINQLSNLRGSKYVQSNTLGVFKQVSTDLKKHHKVLFIGTPCQVAAIKKYIGESSNLLTIDLICHGVPSVKLLIDSLPRFVWSSDISGVEFRASTKYHFSMKSGISTIFERPLNKDLYLKAFFTGLDYRDSCYKCPFACEERLGDITLGDFWGIGLDLNEKDKKQGISLCLVNTDLGKIFLEKVKYRTEQIERPIKEAIAGNHQLRHPKKKTFRTIIFKNLYSKIGFNLATILSIPDIYLKNRLFGNK